MRAVWLLLGLVACGDVKVDGEELDAEVDAGHDAAIDAAPPPSIDAAVADAGWSPSDDGPTNCIEIQYCDGPEDLFPGYKTICKKLVPCSTAEVFAECFADAESVCGGIRQPYLIY